MSEADVPEPETAATESAPAPDDETAKTGLDPLRRFLNIWLMTIAAFGAGGLLVGALEVWPHNYLERNLSGVLLATIQSQLGPALQNGIMGGLLVALVVMISQKLGGRRRVRLALVALLCATATAWLTYVQMKLRGETLVFGVRAAIRWHAPEHVLRSLVHLGMEEEPFRYRVIRIFLVGLIGIVGIFVIHFATRRRLGRKLDEARLPRPSGLIAPIAFMIVLGMILTLGRSATDVIPPGSPDIILISLDTLRADHLSGYGYPRETTPRIDEFARDGVLVENCIATAPWTLPSHASMFTGLMPYEHGAIEPQNSINPRVPMFPEILKQRGYRTGGFVTGLLVAPGYGFNRGFDVYSLHEGFDAAKNTMEAFGWFQLSREPTFLFLHLFDLHYPYRPPSVTYTRFGPATPLLMRPKAPDFVAFLLWADRDPVFASRAALDRYDETLLFQDMVLGRFFETLKQQGRFDNALIIILSDHGEEFFDHGYWGHGMYLYDEAVRVPFIAKLPRGACKGVRVREGQLSVKAVASIVLSAASGPSNANPFLECGPDGMPELLRRVMESGPVFAETMANGPHRFSARTVDRKLIEPFVPNEPRLSANARAWELYNLRNDPGERLNLYAPQVAPELENALGAANKMLADHAGAAVGVDLDAATLQRLRSLGYLQ